MEKKKYKVTNCAESNAEAYVDLDENEYNLLQQLFNNLNDDGDSYAPTLYLDLMK